MRTKTNRVQKGGTPFTRRVQKGGTPFKWQKLAPNRTQRIKMLKKCGKKCFLGPNLSFPVCAKNTCKINIKGLEMAYIRATHWEKKKKKRRYTRVRNKATKLLKTFKKLKNSKTKKIKN